MKKIRKILVANRGEIALRVMRSAKEMGISTVAVYSDSDKHSPHVLYAEESSYIGESQASKSYLNQQKIIEVAKEFKVDAIHPGYGFLSENADFAKLVEKNNIIFIGPPAQSIEIMGDKITSKKTVEKYDVPLIPGSAGSIKNKEEAIEIAKNIGLPILIKASAGGGGKGMRIVRDIENLGEQMDRAISEAQSSFGNPAVFIEKYLEEPKHIEFQIFGDQHGNYAHLFERECSIQRRHQKVIEEAPSPVVTPELRKRMGDAAINVARSCNYYGAGTVEFILNKNGEFYFLEMNTRLQVEHPVTEMITGLDLVKEQITIAEGQKLSFKQEDLEINGHSIETRVYAEDPRNNFLPDIGKLHTYTIPGGPGVRLDDGYVEGMEIPIHYDPMIGKLIVHGKDREEAIKRLLRAIDDFIISGVQHSLPFTRFVLEHEAFLDGSFSTHFVEKFYNSDLLPKTNQDSLEAIAVLHAFIDESSVENKPIEKEKYSQWKMRRNNYG